MTRATPQGQSPDDRGATGVLDAITVCTAAIAGDSASAEVLLRHAMRGPNREETLAALTTTIAMIGEEAREHGLDLGALLADVGLGVQLLALQHDTSSPTRTRPHQRGR